MRDASRPVASEENKDGAAVGGKVTEALMSHKAFCTWFSTLPLSTKAQIVRYATLCWVCVLD